MTKAKTPSQYSLPGHKVKYTTSGAQGSYWTARCTCGWSSKGWYDRKAPAVREASGHMIMVERENPDPNGR